ncbi:shikimate kinase [Parachlamydia sp. AcF125]|uniref:shikimate kinase n=1 Tax=Parachlamydia sp. AcF125 TaxID=2795736 RepID=UPI001BC96F1C|nr:shikimate kinase [Parachlamydia sp. AcF125]MBS4168958.1 Shikimate kinase 1 [Parachlamydia sp. AcF125]
MNLILCGLPKCGKTTIGKILAAQLKWTFLDTDEMIESAYKKEFGNVLSCRQIYLTKGELYFRELEKQQVLALQNRRRSVIATGGGVFHLRENSEMLKNLGTLIYLKVPLKEIWNRISCAEIPPFLGQHEPEKAFYKLSEKRLPLYEAAAHVIIEAHNLNKEEMTAAILNHEEFQYGK